MHTHTYTYSLLYAKGHPKEEIRATRVRNKHNKKHEEAKGSAPGLQSGDVFFRKAVTRGKLGTFENDLESSFLLLNPGFFFFWRQGQRAGSARVPVAVAFFGVVFMAFFSPAIFSIPGCQPRYPVTSGHTPMHRHVPA
jgi:hypothetical protein